jgi:N-acetylmuramoyl-L-alanine amidase
MIEQAGCSHLISLHCNAAGPTASGTETFYRDSADKAWATKVQASAMEAMAGKNRGLKTEKDSQHSRLAIFDFDGPAALLEIGFVTHSGDRAKMLQRETRVKFWNSLLTQLSS